MKKISLIALAICATTMVFAQRTSFGLKAGLNYSTLTNQDYKVGYHLGALAHIHMSPTWAMQPELVYSNQGGEYTLSNGQKHKLNLNYVNIPVLFQYMVGTGLRLETGPQVGFLAGVEDKVNDVQTGYFTSSDFKNVDFSWPIGFSYIGTRGLGVDARYNIGLSNINNAGVSNIKNNVLQVGLFYQFH
jgi:hypothetical protein